MIVVGCTANTLNMESIMAAPEFDDEFDEEEEDDGLAEAKTI